MPAHLSLRCLVLTAAISALGPVVPGGAAELNPAALVYKSPDQIKWNPPSAAGSQNAVLVGDPAKPGRYVVLNKWLKGNNFSRPHFHPNDRFITVLKGTWWVGTGNTFEPDTTVALPAGSYVTHFGKEVHYDGAKDGEAWLLIVGEGPETPTPASTPPPPH
jgi:hypothetical protein